VWIEANSLGLFKRFPAKPNGDRTEDYLRQELLQLLHGMTPVVLAANLLNGSLITVIFAGKLPVLLLGGWWALLAAMVGIRTVCWFWFRRDKERILRWRVLIVIGSGISGVLWGGAGVFFDVPGDETHLLVLGFIIGGMGAGAVTALTPYLPAFYAYLFPALVPFMLRLAVQGDPNHLTMAAAYLLYSIGLAILGRRAHLWLKQSLRFRFENSDLVQSLERRVEERTVQLTEINERLSEDILDRQRAEAVLADYGNRQATVAEFGQRALAGIDLDVLFNEAVALVTEKLGVTQTTIWGHRPGSRSLESRAVSGWPAEDMPEISLPDETLSPMGFALVNSQAVCSDNLAQDDRFAAEHCPHLAEAMTVAEVLIPGEHHPFGVLEAMDRGGKRFSDGEISFMQSIANMLASAIERKRVERDVQRLALEDSLTGLPNRALFRDHLQNGLARVKRLGGLLAVLLIDLDHFKDVNDTLGHPVGDTLLASVAGRLRACVRETDPPARLGGDEFALILSELHGLEDAAFVARKVIGQLAEPFEIDGHEIYLGASIGITMCPTDGMDADGLLRNADLALYGAKKGGRNAYQFFSEHMASQVESRKAVERDMRQALTTDQFALHFQPQFDLVSGRLVGAEALLRWRHPILGLLTPREFIPIAEATGLVVPLGEWVLETACDQAYSWRRNGLPLLSTAVNLSPSQCRRGDLVKTIDRIAERTGGDIGWLELEVTERLFMPPEETGSVDVLQRLRERGVTISIDDFGKGYSSLGRLQRLPVNKVKIDKCFVLGVARSRDADLIVRAIIALGRSLGLTVIAEGVENEEQLAFLRSEGCHVAQGYHLGRPLPVGDFTRLLQQSAPCVA